MLFSFTKQHFNIFFSFYFTQYLESIYFPFGSVFFFLWQTWMIGGFIQWMQVVNIVILLGWLFLLSNRNMKIWEEENKPLMNLIIHPFLLLSLMRWTSDERVHEGWLTGLRRIQLSVLFTTLLKIINRCITFNLI